MTHSCDLLKKDINITQLVSILKYKSCEFLGFLNSVQGRAIGKLHYISVNWQFHFFYGRYFSFL